VIRRHRFALAFLALMSGVIFLSPLLKGHVFQLRDHFDYFQPLRWFTADELRAGHIPFWNPYSASGEPWFSNPQTGVFYPPAWIFVALPFATAYMLFLWFHLALLGGGAYLLFARRNSTGAALVGAAAIVFSGPVLSLLDVSNNLCTLAWIPLALWCASEGAWKRGGIVLALAFLGGEPFFAAIAALLYAIVRRRRDVIGTAFIAFGLTAVQLLPFIEMIRGSDRSGGLDAPEILRESMPLVDWLRVIAPSSFFHTPPAQTFIPSVYAGIVVTLLALIGLTTLRKRRDLFGWIALLVVAAFFATGPSWLEHMPVTLFRYPARLVPIAILAFGALAAAGWDRFGIRDKRWLDLIIVLVLAADLVPRARPLLEAGPWGTNVVPYDRAIGAQTKFLRVGDTSDPSRVGTIGGYLNLYDHRFDAFTAAPLLSASYFRSYVTLQHTPTRAALDAAAIGWVISARELPGGLRKVQRAWGVNAYAIPNPRAMAVSISSSRVTPLTWEMSTSHARVIVDGREASTVTIAQQDAPGWSVAIDGQPAKKAHFFEVFRAVHVPAGRHEIVWTYRPRTFFIGAVMTVVTLLSLMFSVFVKRAK